MELLRTMNAPPLLNSLVRETNYENNKREWAENKDEYMMGNYIEYQWKMDEMLYGMDMGDMLNDELFNGRPLTAAENACEVIAIYNALSDLTDGNPPIDLPDIMYDMEGKGTMLAGNFGITPYAIEAYINGIDGCEAK